MLGTWLRLPGPAERAQDPATAGSLARAAAALARLDQALSGHPLQRAFLHRARLEAVRRQAAVDGQAIDPWHLAALLEGLRLRMDHGLRIIDRGAIFAGAHHALELHRWLVEPDFDQECEVQRATTVLAGADVPGGPPLLAAAGGVHAWLQAGEARAPMRAALVRHWTRHRLLHAPVPLTGTAALRAEVAWDPEQWTPVFLTAVADEAEEALLVLGTLERAWFAARGVVAGRRRHSRAPAAVDLLAATPLLSASTLAAGLGMTVKNAAALLEEFQTMGLAVEVTHRCKRRLFGLAGLAPLRDGVAPPRRPEPGRGRGRPPHLPEAEEELVPELPPIAPLGPRERRAFDYGELEEAMALAEASIRQARRNLAVLRMPAARLGPDPNSASPTTCATPNSSATTPAGAFRNYADPSQTAPALSTALA